MSPPRYRFLIIGAGPTGIGAALRLLELGVTDFLLIEVAAGPGGLAASVVDDQGFTWDLGGHVQFSHYQQFDPYMDLALGADGWITHQRESWVWIRDRFIPYPLQYNLHRLPREDTWRCVQGLLEHSGPSRRTAPRFRRLDPAYLRPRHRRPLSAALQPQGLGLSPGAAERPLGRRARRGPRSPDGHQVHLPRPG